MVLNSDGVFRHYEKNPPYHRKLLANSQKKKKKKSWCPNVRQNYDFVCYLLEFQLCFDGF
jgi:hypothetical protein